MNNLTRCINLLLVILLLPILSITAQDFTENIITKPNRWIQPQFVDFDGDGDSDVISLGKSGNVVWWENLNGTDYEKQVLITTQRTWRDFDIADFDGDGDLDIVAVDINNLYIYYNNGDNTFTQISNGFNFNSSNVVAGNFDSDSDIEFVTSEGNTNGRIRLWNRQPNNFFQAMQIGTLRISELGSLIAHDLDTDGDLDLIASLRFVSGSNSVFYYLNDGSGSFIQQSVSYGNSNYLNQVVDFDSDGDMDIVVKNSFDCCVTVLVNDGSLSFTQTDVITGLSALDSAFFVDGDNDGDIDIYTVHSDPVPTNPERYVGVFENDGSNSYTFQEISALGGGNYIHAADITSDNLPELIVGSDTDDHPIVFQNNDLQSFTTNVLDDTIISPDMSLGDIDGDGLEDVVLVSDDITLWHNLGNYEFEKISIGTTVLPVRSFEISDIDGNGIMDIFVSTFSFSGGGEMLWYQNDGSLNFTEQNYLSINAETAFFGDIDSDGDQDLIYSAGRPRYIRNDGGTSQTVFISQELNNPPISQLVDVNGDGHKDVLTDSEIYYLNDGTSESFTEMTLPKEGTMADLDSDGDEDIIFNEVSSNGTYLGWHENDGTGSFTLNVISDPYRGRSIVVRDFDGDGDKDIITSAFNDFNSEGLILWKNNGSQQFTKAVIEDEYYIDRGNLYQADLDGDGDIEVISSDIKFPFTIWNNESDVPLSLTDIPSITDILIHPTIAQNNIYINTSRTISSVSIYTIDGKYVPTKVQRNIIDVTELKQGMYILIIEDTEGRMVVRKFMKN